MATTAVDAPFERRQQGHDEDAASRCAARCGGSGCGRASNGAAPERPQTPIPAARTVRRGQCRPAQSRLHGALPPHRRRGAGYRRQYRPATPLPPPRWWASPGRVDAIEPSPTMRAVLIEAVTAADVKSMVVIHPVMVGQRRASAASSTAPPSPAAAARPPRANWPSAWWASSSVRLEKLHRKRPYALIYWTSPAAS